MVMPPGPHDSASRRMALERRRRAFTWLVGTAVASLAFGMLPGLHLVLWIHVLADIALGVFVGYLIRSRNMAGYSASYSHRGPAASAPGFAGAPPVARAVSPPASAPRMRVDELVYSAPAEHRRPLSYEPFQGGYEPAALRRPVAANGNGASSYTRRPDSSGAAVIVRPSSKVKLKLDEGRSFGPGTISGQSGAVDPREVQVVRRGNSGTPARSGSLDFFVPDEDEALAVTGG